jgi:hypothetical protein
MLSLAGGICGGNMEYPEGGCSRFETEIKILSREIDR